MMGSSHFSVQNEISQHGAIISSIDHYLADIHDALRTGFQDGASSPTEDSLLRLQIVEEIWKSLDMARSISFDKLDDLHKYFAQYHKNIGLHLQDYTDFVSPARKAATDLFSPANISLLKAMVPLFYECTKIKFHLLQLQGASPSTFQAGINKVKHACDSIDFELQHIDMNEINRERLLLSSFIRLVTTCLNEKSFHGISVDLGNDGGTGAYLPDLIELEMALHALHPISEINGFIHEFQTAKSNNRHVDSQRAILQSEIEQCERVNNALLKVADRLKKCTLVLDNIANIDNMIDTQTKALNQYDEIMLRYRSVLILAGYDDKSRQEQMRYVSLQSAIRGLRAECQASKAWGRADEKLRVLESGLINQLTRMMVPYLEMSKEVNILCHRKQVVRENQHKADHERTLLAARLAQAQSVLHVASGVMIDSIKTLSEHTETQFTYTRDFLKRHWGKLFLGGGIGTGLGAGLGCLSVVAAAPILFGSTLGLVIGSGASAGVGLLKDQYFPDPPPAFAVDASMTIIKPTSSEDKQVPLRHWYSKFTIFHKPSEMRQPPLKSDEKSSLPQPRR